MLRQRRMRLRMLRKVTSRAGKEPLTPNLLSLKFLGRGGFWTVTSFQARCSVSRLTCGGQKARMLGPVVPTPCDTNSGTDASG